jgi:hypothetical protein
MKRLLALISLVVPIWWSADTLSAFCGFYVCKADTRLFNQASQVVLVRDDDKTVLTMANDFKGDPKEFAVVIPVPTVLERGQIHVGDKALLDHLDAYSAPRLVEYFDENPCAPSQPVRIGSASGIAGGRVMAAGAPRSLDSLGVKIEASYTIGEYDILLLSAQESGGLETWLRRSGYQIPSGASSVLASYIRQGMKFFVARVNLKEQAKLGFTFLRPIQVAYESPKFMLPIRLGMVNAAGPQELFVYALTRRGRVEATNYRTVKLPTGMDLPVYVKQEFPAFYRAMFDQQVRLNRMEAVFTEYAWDMAWCDPCAADPLSAFELGQLGVFWLEGGAARPSTGGSGGSNVFITRLHVRYDAAHFPEDLVFQQTADRTNFQGRYVLRHPWTGTESCEAAASYRSALAARSEHEAQSLAGLTGWNIADIRGRMRIAATRWWQRIW